VSRSSLFLACSVLAAGMVALTGCAASDSPAPAQSVSPPTTADGGAAQQPGGHHGGHASPSDTGPALYAVQSGPLGVVATDGSGHLMYRSDADGADPSTSNCTGPCAQTWLPVLVAAGQEPELLGVDPGVVGRFTRPEGTSQLTIAGWPLYRHRDDQGGLQSAGQNGADGIWFAVTPTGDKATAG
jgi:predicted lipoprotein with Yx(FWY)xxD motif